MACVIVGQDRWEGTRDSEGHRTWKIRYRVRCDITDGPANALQTPGLPLPGSYWIIQGDVDIWAWCRLDNEIVPEPKLDQKPNNYFLITFTFSTKPPDRDKQRCNTTQIEDPLLEPQKVSGGFNKYTEEATYDRFGEALVNSAFEQIRGPQVEFDKNRVSVKISQNVLNLDLPNLGMAQNTVNQFEMWGCPVRSVKLSASPWERKFYGTCFVYFTRSFEFDIFIVQDPDTGDDVSGWDKDLVDEGTKVLSGHWGVQSVDGTTRWVLDRIGGPTGVRPDPNNPAHFIRFKDRNGENSRVVLNGFGLPFDPTPPLSPGTTAVAAIPTPGTIIVTPVAMQTYMVVGAILAIDVGLESQEGVVITAVTGTTFTAKFSKAHAANFTITDAIAGISQPGTIHVEKYDETDFITVFALPTDITSPLA